MVIGTRTSVPSRSAGTDRGRKRFCYVVKPPRGRQFREVHLAWIAMGRLRLATLCLHYSRQSLVFAIWGRSQRAPVVHWRARVDTRAAEARKRLVNSGWAMGLDLQN